MERKQKERACLTPGTYRNERDIDVFRTTPGAFLKLKNTLVSSPNCYKHLKFN